MSGFANENSISTASLEMKIMSYFRIASIIFPLLLITSCASIEDMRTSMVRDALRMSWFRRKPNKTDSLIFRRDRGSQYCCEAYQAELTRFNIQPSMSRKRDCWDETPTESLWGSLKVGRLHGRGFATRRERWMK